MGGMGHSGQEAFLEQLAAGWRPHAHVRGPVVLAVSGGGDSVALLRGLHQLREEAGTPASQQLVVAHAHHDLRKEHAGDPAAADAAFVRQLAVDLGLPCVQCCLRVREAVQGGEGLEAAARRLRYGFLREVAESRGARLIAVAHTADDQVETVLHRLLRGTGLTGLAGMPAVRTLVEGMVVVRPMLAVSAAVARAYLQSIGQAWQEDATNTDTRYARNLLRHELLPRLAAGPYPAVREAIPRLAEQARQTHETLQAACEALLEAYTSTDLSGTVVVRAKPLAACPLPLLSDLMATLWRQQGWPRRDMTSRHYMAVATLLSQPGTAASVDLPGGLRAQSAAGGFVRISPGGVTPRQAPPHHR